MSSASIVPDVAAREPVQRRPTSARVGWACGFATLAIWTGFVLVTRIGGRSPLTAWDVMALRFAVGATVVLPAWLFWRRVELRDLRLIALAAVGGLLYAGLVYSAFRHAPAAHASILLAGIQPFEVALLGWWLLGERPTRARVRGLVAIAAGVACLGVQAFSSSASWIGDLLLVCASASWALYTVLARRWRIPAWDATIAGALIGALLYLPVWWAFLPTTMDTAPIGAIVLQALYQGVLAIVVAMVLYMKTLEMLGAARTGMLLALTPASAGMLAVPLLGEPLGPWLAAGLILTTLGAWLGSRG